MIYIQALSVALGYGFSVYLMDILYVHHHIEDAGLAFGYAFCLVEGCVIAVLLMLSLVIKFVRHRREARWLRLQPSIIQEISAHLSGVDNTSKVMTLRKRHPREVEQCMLDMLLRVRGTTLARLTTLISDIGLVERWTRQYRSRIAANRRNTISRLRMLAGDAGHETMLLALNDTNDEVKLEASRSLISAGKIPELEAVFRTALRDSLLVRAILTEALRPYAPLLYESAVPEAFSSDDPKTVRIALEIVWAWRKSLPLARVQPLLHHPDGAVRAAALAIVPQMVSPMEFETELIESLADEAEGVRAAAANAAGKLRLSSALPALKACLERGGADSTVAAAYALTRLGAQGWHILEQQVLSSRSMAASAALEAIEQARSERLIPGTV